MLSSGSSSTKAGGSTTPNASLTTSHNATPLASSPAPAAGPTWARATSATYTTTPSTPPQHGNKARMTASSSWAKRADSTSASRVTPGTTTKSHPNTSTISTTSPAPHIQHHRQWKTTIASGSKTSAQWSASPPSTASSIPRSPTSNTNSTAGSPTTAKSPKSTPTNSAKSTPHSGIPRNLKPSSVPTPNGDTARATYLLSPPSTPRPAPTCQTAAATGVKPTSTIHPGTRAQVLMAQQKTPPSISAPSST